MQRRRSEERRPFTSVLCRSREFFSGTDITSSQSSEELKDRPSGQRFRCWARRIWNISNDIATRLKDLLRTTSISHVSVSNRSLETSCSECLSDTTSCTDTTKTTDGRNSKHNEHAHVPGTQHCHAVPSSYYYIPGIYGVTENHGENKTGPYVRNLSSSPYPVLVLPRICPSNQPQIFNTEINQPRPGSDYRYHTLGPLQYNEDWIRRNYQMYCQNHHYSHAQDSRTQNLAGHQIPEKLIPRNEVKAKHRRDKVNGNCHMPDHRVNEYAKTDVQDESFSWRSKIYDRNKEISHLENNHESNDFYRGLDNHCIKSNSLFIKTKKVARSAQQLSDIISQDSDSSNQSADGISINVPSSQSNVLSVGTNDHGSVKADCEVLQSIEGSLFESETPKPERINKSDIILTLDRNDPGVCLECRENSDITIRNFNVVEDSCQKRDNVDQYSDDTRISLAMESYGDSLQENLEAQKICTPNIKMCSNCLQINATSLAVEREEDEGKSSLKTSVHIKGDTLRSCEQDEQNLTKEESSDGITNLRSSFSERIRGIWQGNSTGIQNMFRENGSLELNCDELKNGTKTCFLETGQRTPPKECFEEYSAALKLASILEKMIEAKQTMNVVSNHNQTSELPKPPPRLHRRCSKSKVSHIGIQYSADDDSSSSSTISTIKKRKHRKLKKDTLLYASIEGLKSSELGQHVSISNRKFDDFPLETPRPLQIFTEHSIVPISSIQIASAVRQTPFYGFGDLSDQHSITIDHPVIQDGRDKPILDNCTSDNRPFSQSYLYSVARLRSNTPASLETATSEANANIEDLKGTREKNLLLLKPEQPDWRKTPILCRTISSTQQQEMRTGDPSIFDQIDGTLVMLCPSQSHRNIVQEESVTMKVICSWLAKKFRLSKNNTNLPVAQSFHGRECNASKSKKFTLLKCARNRNALQRFVGRTFIAKVEAPTPPVRRGRKNRVVFGDNSESRKTIRWDLQESASSLKEREKNEISEVPISNNRESTTVLQIKDPTNDPLASKSKLSKSLGQKTLTRWKKNNTVRESSKYRISPTSAKVSMDESIERTANISTLSTCDPNIDSYKLTPLINDSGVGGTVDYLQTNSNKYHVNAAPSSRDINSVTNRSTHRDTLANSHKIECVSEDSVKELESCQEFEAMNIEPKSKEKVERSHSGENIDDVNRNIKSLQKNRDLVKVSRDKIKSRDTKRSFDKQDSLLRTIGKIHLLDVERLPSRKGPTCKNITNNVNSFPTEFDLSVPAVNLGSLKRSSNTEGKTVSSSLKESSYLEPCKGESQNRSGSQNNQLENFSKHVNDKTFLKKKKRMTLEYLDLPPITGTLNSNHSSEKGMKVVESSFEQVFRTNSSNKINSNIFHGRGKDKQLAESSLTCTSNTANLKISFNMKSDLRGSLRETARFGMIVKRLRSVMIGKKEIRNKKNSIESIGHPCKSFASLKRFGPQRCFQLSKMNVRLNDNNEISQGIANSFCTSSQQELSENDRFRKLFLWRANAKAVRMNTFRFGSMRSRKNAETSKSEWSAAKMLAVNVIGKSVLDQNFVSMKRSYSSYLKKRLLSRKIEMKKRKMRYIMETLKPMNILQRISEETLEDSVNVTDRLEIDSASRDTNFNVNVQEEKSTMTTVGSQGLKIKLKSEDKEHVNSLNEEVPSTTSRTYSNEKGEQDEGTKKKRIKRKIIKKISKSIITENRTIDTKLNEDTNKGKQKNESKQISWIKRLNFINSNIPTIVTNPNKKKEKKVVEEEKEGRKEEETEKNKSKQKTIGVQSEFLKQQRRCIVAESKKEKERMFSQQCDDSTTVRLINNNDRNDDNNNNNESLCLNNFNSDRASNNTSFITGRKSKTSDFEFIRATLMNRYSKFTNIKPNTQGSLEILITVVDSENNDGTVNQGTDSNKCKREKKQPECISQFLNFINQRNTD